MFLQIWLKSNMHKYGMTTICEIMHSHQNFNSSGDPVLSQIHTMAAYLYALVEKPCYRC